MNFKEYQELKKDIENLEIVCDIFAKYSNELNHLYSIPEGYLIDNIQLLMGTIRGKIDDYESKQNENQLQLF